MTVAQNPKAWGEAAKEGLKVMAFLAEQLENALGLKEYAETLEEFLAILAHVNDKLEEKEQATAEELVKAQNLARSALISAALAVEAIHAETKKTQKFLILVKGKKDEKRQLQGIHIFMAKYQKALKNGEVKITEAREKLLLAINAYEVVKSLLGNCIVQMEKEETRLIAEMNVGLEKQESQKHHKWWAVIAGPWALIITHCIVEKVIADNKASIRKLFQEQLENFKGYHKTFEDQLEDTKNVQENLEKKNEDLGRVLIAVGTTKDSVEDLINDDRKEAYEEFHLPEVEDQMLILIRACEKFGLAKDAIEQKKKKRKVLAGVDFAKTKKRQCIRQH